MADSGIETGLQRASDQIGDGQLLRLRRQFNRAQFVRCDPDAMKKYWPLLALAVMLSAIVGVSQYAESAKHHYEESAKQAKAAAVAKSDDGKAHDDADNPYESPVWAKYVTLPEGVGAWAVILTLFVIAWQSIETREAASAARGSIRLQEAGMRQWLNIVPIGISKCVRPDKPGLCEVSLRFEIINKTDYLMTILRIETNVGANVHESTKSVIECNQPLVPQKSDGDSSHPFYAKTLVDAGIWNEKGRIFVVTGLVAYLDCMEVRRTQSFEDRYIGVDNGELRRMKPSGIGATVEG